MHSPNMYKKNRNITTFRPVAPLFIWICHLGIAAFLVINQANKATSSLAATAETNKDVLEGLIEVLQSMDRITTGSGIRASGTWIY